MEALKKLTDSYSNNFICIVCCQHPLYLQQPNFRVLLSSISYLGIDDWRHIGLCNSS